MCLRTAFKIPYRQAIFVLRVIASECSALAKMEQRARGEKATLIFRIFRTGIDQLKLKSNKLRINSCYTEYLSINDKYNFIPSFYLFFYPTKILPNSDLNGIPHILF